MAQPKRVFIVQGWHSSPNGEEGSDDLASLVRRHRKVRDKITRGIILKERITHYFIDGTRDSSAEMKNECSNDSKNCNSPASEMEGLLREMFDPDGFVETVAYCRNNGVDIQVRETESSQYLYEKYLIAHALDIIPNLLNRIINFCLYVPSIIYAFITDSKTREEPKIEEVRRVVPAKRLKDPNYFSTRFRTKRDQEVYEHINRYGGDTNLLFMGSAHPLAPLYTEDSARMQVYGVIIDKEARSFRIKTNMPDIPDYFREIVENSIDVT
jgi:hypothetical protein